MSLSRGEVMGFIRGYIHSGKSLDEAKNQFQNWLNIQNDSVATDDEKKSILNDLYSYKG